MLRRSLLVAVRRGWPFLTAVPLLVAAVLLWPAGQPQHGAAVVAEAADLRRDLLMVAAGADDAAASGGSAMLDGAVADLESGQRSLSGDAGRLLGRAEAGAAMAALGVAIDELVEAAQAYAGGVGTIGAGGPAYTAASLALDDLIDELVSGTDAAR